MLRRGQTFTMAGKRWRVDYVNASRAHCVTEVKVTVTVRGRTFTARRREYTDISPNSGVELLTSMEAR